MAKNNKKKQEEIIEEEIVVDDEGNVTEEVTVVEEDENDNNDDTEQDSEVIVEDEITINDDGSVIEEVTLVEEDLTKENKDSDKEKKQMPEGKQFAIWFILIIAIIGAMFASKYFVDDYNKKQEVNAQVDSYVENVRVNLANKETKAAIKENDVVVMDFTGYIDGKEFDGGSNKDARIRIGSKVFIDGFENQLIGKKSGDKVDVKVTFPENYENESLKGKEATFKVTIKHVYIFPAADDKLAEEYVKIASKNGDENAKNIKTFKEFKAYLKNYVEQMNAYYEEMAKQQQQQQDNTETTDDSTENAE